MLKPDTGYRFDFIVYGDKSSITFTTKPMTGSVVAQKSVVAKDLSPVKYLSPVKDLSPVKEEVLRICNENDYNYIYKANGEIGNTHDELKLKQCSKDNSCGTSMSITKEQGTLITGANCTQISVPNNVYDMTCDACPIVESHIKQSISTTTSDALTTGPITADYKNWAINWKLNAQDMIKLILSYDKTQIQYRFKYKLVNFYEYVDFKGLTEIRQHHPSREGNSLKFNNNYQFFIRFTFKDLKDNTEIVDEYRLFNGGTQYWSHMGPTGITDLFSAFKQQPVFSGRKPYDVYVQLLTKCNFCQKMPDIIGTGITEPLKFRMEPLQHQMQFNLWPNMRIPEYNIEPIHFYKPGYPFISRISSTSVDIKFKFLEYTGLVRWMIVPYGHTSLQNYEIETLPLNAPNRISNGNLTIRNANEYTITSNSLIANSGYRFHFVLVGETDLKLDNKNYIQFNTNIVINPKLLMHQHWYNEFSWF